MTTTAIDTDNHPATFYVRGEGGVEAHPVSSVEEGYRRFGPIFAGPVRVLAIAAEPTKGGVSVAAHGVGSFTLKVTSKTSAADLRRKLRDADPDLLVVARRSEDDEDALHLIVEALEGLGITLDLRVAGRGKPRRVGKGWSIDGRQVLGVSDVFGSVQDIAKHCADLATASLPALRALLTLFSPASLSEIIEAPSIAIGRSITAKHRSQGLSVDRASGSYSKIKGPSAWAKEGLYRGLCEIDYSAFYPRIVLANKLSPLNDKIGAYLDLMGSLAALREEFRGKTGERYVKSMAVKAVGILNSEFFDFRDADALKLVYADGRRLLFALLDVADEVGGEVQWHMTDGALVSNISDVAGLRTLLTTVVGEAHPFSIESSIDAIVFDKMNRILRSKSGELRWKGSKPKALSRLGLDEFINELLNHEWEHAGAIRAGLSSHILSEPSVQWLDGRLIALLDEGDARSAIGNSRFEVVSGHAYSLDSVQRAARNREANRAARRRLDVFPSPTKIPCVESIAEQIRRAPHLVGTREVDKALAEMRLAEVTKTQAARKLAPTQPAFERLVELGIAGGMLAEPVLEPSSWPSQSLDQLQFACSSGFLVQHCERDACYRRDSALFHATAPSAEEYTRQVRREAEQLVRVPGIAQPIVAVEVPCRGGKTYQVARRAIDFVLQNPGKKVKRHVGIVVPDHTAGEAAMAELKAAAKEKGATKILVVQQYGRDRRGATDPELCTRTNARGCGSCSYGDPKRLKRMDRRKGIFYRDQLRRAAERLETCGRTLSRALAPYADIVIITVTAFITADETLRPFDALFIDEADRFGPALAEYATHRLSLAVFRTSRNEHFAGPCEAQGCSRCRVQFPVRGDSTKGWVFERVLDTVSSRADPSGWVARIERGLSLLLARVSPHGPPPETVTAIQGFLGGLRRALGAVPHDQSPRQAFEALRRVQVPGWTWSDEAEALVWPLPILVGVDELLGVEPGDDQDVADQIYMVQRLLSFLAASPRRVLLEARAKPGRKASFMATCTLELSFFDTAAHARVIDRLRDARTLMVSGTLGDASVFRAGLLLKPEELAVRYADVPMHAEVTGIIYTGIRRRGPQSGVFLDQRGVLELIEEIGAQDRAVRIHLFADTKKRASSFFKLLSASSKISARLSSGTNLLRKRVTRQNTIGLDIDYLRGGESRSIPSDHDLIIVWGSGRPNFQGFGPRADAIGAVTGDLVSRDDLAEHARRNEIAQSSLRHVGSGGRRVILLIGDHWLQSIPRYLRDRFVNVSAARDLENVPDFARGIVDVLRSF